MAEKTSDLLINGSDAYETYGIRMGDGFIDNINAFSTMKAYVDNTSRLENGKRVVISDPKVSEGSVSLIFLLEGKTHADFKTKKAAFKAALEKGYVTIQVPKDSDDVYHLIYRKGTSYAQNYHGTFCKVACMFDEPNPANRTAASEGITVLTDETTE